MQSTELKSVVLFYLRRSNHVINLNCIKMADQAKCIFEFCEVKNEKINLFTATTLKTCQDKLKIKKICGIFVNFDQCYVYEVSEDGKVIKTIDEVLSCPQHEEADTKIVYHVCQIQRDCNIIVKCNDTDILIIMLSNMKNMKSKSKIWIEFGNACNKKTLDICKIYEEFGETFCKALAGFHASTGCDYVSSFFNKGKKRPFNILRKVEKYQQAFYALGNSLCDYEDVFAVLETFVCDIYGVKTTKTIFERKVNDVRFAFFRRQYEVKKVDEPFLKKKIRNFDASSLPPCQSELRQHLLRTRYVTNIWLNAYKQIPTQLKPEESGWILKDDS